MNSTDLHINHEPAGGTPVVFTLHAEAEVTPAPTHETEQ